MLKCVKVLIEVACSVSVDFQSFGKPCKHNVFNFLASSLQTLRINGTLPYSKIGGIIFYDADEIYKVMKDNSIHNKY